MEIITERTVLRVLEENDVSSQYVDWLNDPEINRYLESRFVEHTNESIYRFVRQNKVDPLIHLFGIFIDNDHIGNVKLGPVVQEHKRANLGIMIGNKEYWGRGIAVEVIRAIVTFAFSDLGIRKVDAGCYESHLASKRSFIKAGFQVECLLPDHVINDGHREGVFLLGILAD